jgi:glycosyltransferase involved in cell wall biosynthesis
MAEKSSTKFSIIVTSYTTERLDDIRELLESIRAQTYPDTETIFIIERSRELYEEVKAIGQDMPSLKVLYNDDEPGLSAARNMGVKEARGEIIAFSDDDALLTPRWAEETVKAYDGDGSIIGLTGPILPLWEDPAMDWFPREFYWVFSCTYHDWTTPRKVRNGYGTNISFKREAFVSSGLFSTNLGAMGGGESGKHELSGDETELSIRVRMKTGKYIIYNPNIRVQHRVNRYRLTPAFLASRGYWEGYTKAMFKRVYHDNGNNEKLLDTEYELLKRIFFRLFPGILKGFFTKPVTAWRKFSVTVVILSSTAVGYLSCLLKIHGRKHTSLEVSLNIN